jgi:hypothetical protein
MIWTAALCPFWPTLGCAIGDTSYIYHSKMSCLAHERGPCPWLTALQEPSPVIGKRECYHPFHQSERHAPPSIGCIGNSTIFAVFDVLQTDVASPASLISLAGLEQLSIAGKSFRVHSVQFTVNWAASPGTATAIKRLYLLWSCVSTAPPSIFDLILHHCMHEA